MLLSTELNCDGLAGLEGKPQIQSNNKVGMPSLTHAVLK